MRQLRNLKIFAWRLWIAWMMGEEIQGLDPGFSKMGEEIQGLDPGLLKLGKIQGLDPPLLSTVNTNSGDHMLPKKFLVLLALLLSALWSDPFCHLGAFSSWKQGSCWCWVPSRSLYGSVPRRALTNELMASDNTWWCMAVRPRPHIYIIARTIALWILLILPLTASQLWRQLARHKQSTFDHPSLYIHKNHASGLRKCAHIHKTLKLTLFMNIFITKHYRCMVIANKTLKGLSSNIFKIHFGLAALPIWIFSGASQNLFLN